MCPAYIGVGRTPVLEAGGKLLSLARSFRVCSFAAGTIPPELGNLAALESLHLDGNQLSGEAQFANTYRTYSPTRRRPVVLEAGNCVYSLRTQDTVKHRGLGRGSILITRGGKFPFVMFSKERESREMSRRERRRPPPAS